MFKNILCSLSAAAGVPFVLCNLLAPDTGAPAGGDAPPPAPNPNPEPPLPAKPPEPEGETIEAKLKSAVVHIGNLFRRVGELASQLATANTQRSKLEGQFKAVSDDLTKEKEEHGKTKGELAKTNTMVSGLTTERDNANANVERLEKLCSLRGIDPSQAVPVPHTDKPDHDSKRAELVSKLDKETDPLKRGQIANELREMDRKRREKNQQKG